MVFRIMLWASSRRRGSFAIAWLNLVDFIGLAEDGKVAARLNVAITSRSCIVRALNLVGNASDNTLRESLVDGHLHNPHGIATITARC